MFILNVIALILFLCILYLVVKSVQNMCPGRFTYRLKVASKPDPKAEENDYIKVVEKFDNAFGEIVKCNEPPEPKNAKKRGLLHPFWGSGCCKTCDFKAQYADLIKDLKIDLMQSERRCRHLQQQLGWVSNKTNQLEEKVLEGQKEFVCAVKDLASNLHDVQQVAPMKPNKSKPKACNCDCEVRDCPLVSRFKTS